MQTECGILCLAMMLICFQGQVNTVVMFLVPWYTESIQIVTQNFQCQILLKKKKPLKSTICEKEKGC